MKSEPVYLIQRLELNHCIIQLLAAGGSGLEEESSERDLEASRRFTASCRSISSYISAVSSSSSTVPLNAEINQESR